MTDERPQEVEAEVLEPPATLTNAERWLAGARERVGELAPRYGTHEIASEADYRDIKQARTMLRKDIAAIDGERKEMTRAVEDEVARFRNGCASVLEPLREIERGYKEQLDAWDDAWLSRRMALLQGVYEQAAPLLVPLVPLERLCDRFAKADKWLLRGTGDVKAGELLTRRLETVSKEWNSLDKLDMSPQEREMAKAEYTRTLDLGAATSRVVDERERRAQIAEIDVASGPEPEPGPRESPAVEAARRAHEASMANPAPEPAPTAPEPTARYAFEFECTPSQLSALMAFLKSAGIHGKRRKVA